MKDLINSDGSIEVHEEFFIQDKRLQIIGSKDFYHSNIWNMLEEVKNLDTGKIIEMKREDLSNYKPYIK